jgi:hypothetical protein
MALGASASFTVVVTVSPGTPNGTISNTADVSAATTDPNLVNNSQTATTDVLTPLINVAPAVVNVQRFGFHEQPSVLVVTFSMPLDSAQALNAANYRIVTVGGPGRGGSLRGHVTRVGSVVYNALAQTVTLHMAARMDIHNLYRITINGAAGGLTGSNGMPLDGAGSGQGGSDYVGYLNAHSVVGPSTEAVRISRPSAARAPRTLHAVATSAVHMTAVSRRHR